MVLLMHFHHHNIYYDQYVKLFFFCHTFLARNKIVYFVVYSFCSRAQWRWWWWSIGATIIILITNSHNYLETKTDRQRKRQTKIDSKRLKCWMFKFQKKIILNKENHHINSHSILKLFIFIQVKCFQQEKKDDIRNW